MFSSPSTSPANRSPRLGPLHSNGCHLEQSEGSASAFHLAARRSPLLYPELQVATRHFPVTQEPQQPLSLHAIAHTFRHPWGVPTFAEFSFARCIAAPKSTSVTPFLATLTNRPQLNESKTTLSLAFATLTSHVSHNPFVCHSYKKTPGGYIPHTKFLSCPSFPAHTRSPGLVLEDEVMQHYLSHPREMTPLFARRLEYAAGNEFAANRLFARMKSGAAEGSTGQITCR